MANDGTSYEIDIAAGISGESHAIDSLLALSDKLEAAGASATTFDSAIASTKSALERAAGASSAAADALAAGEEKYRAMERAAVLAAKAVERAGLKASGSVPADLGRKAREAADALRGEAVALDALRGSAAAAASEQERLTGTLRKLEAGAKAQGRTMAGATGRSAQLLEKLGGALGRIGGPLGTMGSQAAGGAKSMLELGAVMGALPALGIAVAASIALVVAGIALGVAATARWAVGLADAARSSRLHVAALEQTDEALAGLGAVLPGVARATGLGSDELGALAQKLAAAKVTAADMPEALRAAALAEAALGKGGADQFVKRLEDGKQTVGEFASELEGKFGGIVAAKLLGLDAQSKRLKSNLAATFGGLNIDPLLGALSRLVELFDQNTAMGKTLKWVFDSVFQPLIDTATDALYAVEAFALGVAIQGLRIYIGLKPAIRAFESLLGGPDEDGLTGTLELAETAGKAVALVLASAITLTAAFAAAIVLPIYAFGKLLGAGVAAGEAIGAAIGSVVEYLRGTDLAAVGLEMIKGLALGIAGASPFLLDAITGAVSGAISAAKSLLGIASPSRVFAEMGGQTAEGFAGGVDRGAADARSALERMVEPPAASAAPGGGLTARGLGKALDLAGATFVFNGVKDAEQAEHRFGELLTRLLEGDVEQLGAADQAEAPANA